MSKPVRCAPREMRGYSAGHSGLKDQGGGGPGESDKGVMKWFITDGHNPTSYRKKIFSSQILRNVTAHLVSVS